MYALAKHGYYTYTLVHMYPYDGDMKTLPLTYWGERLYQTSL